MTQDSRVIREAHVVETAKGQWRVKAIGGNGEQILISEEYVDMTWAEHVALDLNVPVWFIPRIGERFQKD